MTLTPNTIEYTLDLGILGEVDATISYYYTPFKRGRFSGPPENCYPDEPAEIEVLNVTIPGVTLVESVQVALVSDLQNDDNLLQCVIDEAEAV